MAQYHYTTLPGSKSIQRPYLRLRLTNPVTHKQTPPLRGLIDSGADICLGSHELAVWLGLQFDGQEEKITITTANGTTTDAVKKSVLLTTEAGQYHCPFFFAEGIPPDAPPLLGQQGFFDHFRVCFELRTNTFEIT